MCVCGILLKAGNEQVRLFSHKSGFWWKSVIWDINEKPGKNPESTDSSSFCQSGVVFFFRVVGKLLGNISDISTILIASRLVSQCLRQEGKQLRRLNGLYKGNVQVQHPGFELWVLGRAGSSGGFWDDSSWYPGGFKIGFEWFQWIPRQQNVLTRFQIAGFSPFQVGLQKPASCWILRRTGR